MFRRGFTLIELLVVISIIALLASVVLASLNTAREKGRLGAGRQFDSVVYHAAGDSAVGVWDFDECTGVVANDRSGNGGIGTLTNMATSSWSSDTPSGTGCSLVFNGSNQSVSVPSSSVFDITGDFTISMWAKTTAKPSAGNYNDVLGRTDGVSLWPGYEWGMNSSGALSIWTSDGSSGAWSGDSGYDIADGKWHHIAAVLSGTTMKFYVDGASKGSFTKTIPAGNTNVLTIGRMSYSSSRYWNGSLDQVRLYSKSLTAQEVGNLYASEASRRALVNNR